MPKIIHIVGRKNNGKTSLIVELIDEFTKKGIRIGSLKHSSHRHELDQPGKDSQRQRIAGANPAVVVSKDLAAVFLTPNQGEDLFGKVQSYFIDCDLVIAEGAHSRDATKIEVWREEVGSGLLCEDDPHIVAIVSDDSPPQNSIPVWPRHDVSAIADNILELIKGDMQS